MSLIYIIYTILWVHTLYRLNGTMALAYILIHPQNSYTPTHTHSHIHLLTYTLTNTHKYIYVYEWVYPLTRAYTPNHAHINTRIHTHSYTRIRSHIPDLHTITNQEIFSSCGCNALPSLFTWTLTEGKSMTRLKVIENTTIHVIHSNRMSPETEEYGL